MPEVTLESLAKRLHDLEVKVAGLANGNVIPPTRDWRSVIGISEMTDFSRDMLAEMAASREADREAVRREYGE